MLHVLCVTPVVYSSLFPGFGFVRRTTQSAVECRPRRLPTRFRIRRVVRGVESLEVHSTGFSGLARGTAVEALFSVSLNCPRTSCTHSPCARPSDYQVLGSSCRLLPATSMRVVIPDELLVERMDSEEAVFAAAGRVNLSSISNTGCSC